MKLSKFLEMPILIQLFKVPRGDKNVLNEACFYHCAVVGFVSLAIQNTSSNVK